MFKLNLLLLLSVLLIFSLKIESSRLDKLSFEENNCENEILEPQYFDESTSWFSTFVLELFCPEGLKALERIERFSRLSEPKIFEIEMESKDFNDQVKFFSKLNSIDVIITDTEESDDDEYGYTLPNMTKLKVNIKNGDGDCFSSFSRFFDYQEIIFKAAISQSNFDRLNELLTKKLDKKLTTEQRHQILYDAINIAMIKELGKDNDVPILIISLLLKHNFAIFSDECSLQNVFKNEKVAQTFLEHNSQFFVNLKTFNYVANEIFNRDFKAARLALESGADPEISFFGRNALDVALSIRDYQLENMNSDDLLFLTNITPFSKMKEDPLSYLIRNLREMGLTESMTFDNYFHACNEKRIALAYKILQTGSIKPQEFYFPGNKLTSPISKAIHAEDIDLIKLVTDIFLPHLTANQLQHAHSECYKLLKTKTSLEHIEKLSEILDRISNQ